MNELSTTPDNTNGEQRFTITHPFHPLYGHTFPLLSQRYAWGEERVFFLDPQTQQVRSLPLDWTNLALLILFWLWLVGELCYGGKTCTNSHSSSGRNNLSVRRATDMVQHVTAHHLTRLACLYVRQSTLQQVMENTESTSRQYALRVLAVNHFSTHLLVFYDFDRG